MTPQEKLKKIEEKWTHSRMDYTDSKWLIQRIKTLEEALGKISNCPNLGIFIDAHHDTSINIARKALEGTEE